MARKPWTGEDAITASDLADNTGLRSEATRVSGGKWTISDVLGEMGTGHENRRLAEKMLAEKGVTSPTERQISSQMRNIQRWHNAERGETGKQAHKPSKGAQSMLNAIGRKAAHGNQGARVSLDGAISVNGYKRDSRNIEINMSPDEAERFFEAMDSGNVESAWGMLADAYNVSELHAYDASIDMNWS